MRSSGALLYRAKFPTSISKKIDFDLQFYFWGVSGIEKGTDRQLLRLDEGLASGLSRLDLIDREVAGVMQTNPQAGFRCVAEQLAWCFLFTRVTCPSDALNLLVDDLFEFLLA